jgi:hypothetical protein
MRRPALALVVAIVAAGCGSSSSPTPTTPTTPSTPAAPSNTTILVYGSDMGPLYQNITLESGGSPLSGAQVTVTATIPELPVLVTPVDGGSIHLGTPLSFSWTDGSNPDEFLAGIGYHVGAGGSGQSVTVSGSTRSTTVATAAIPAGATSFTAYVFAYANGTFSGPADPTSRLHIRQESHTVSLVITP